MQLIAERDIDEGEELTMAYVDIATHEGESPSEALERRRKELEAGWKFKCACQKCSEEAEVLDASKPEMAAPGPVGSSAEVDPSENTTSTAPNMEASDVSFVEREAEAEVEA